jgi:hypothetical protein
MRGAQWIDHKYVRMGLPTDIGMAQVDQFDEDVFFPLVHVWLASQLPWQETYKQHFIRALGANSVS